MVIRSMYSLIRPVLFRLDPEQAHTLSLGAICLAGAFPPARAALRWLFNAPQKPVNVFGLDFPNPVGLAAGYDKDGLGWRGLACLGFGHVEIGTVTPRPQPGNPKPRIFRLVDDQAVINRMGFPGQGAEFMVHRLTLTRSPVPVIGVNIGKNKDTPLESAAQDYVSLLRTFAPLADYIAVNISSPNTAGLRRLQVRAALEELLTQLAAERRVLLPQARRPGMLPLLVKFAPDLSDQELDDALAVVQAAGMDGVIATNTTLSRYDLRSPLAGEAGGLSGAPLTALSLAMVRKIVRRSAGRLPVIGVGGIMTPSDAQAMLDAGAALVQVYTGLIYAGPAFVRQIVKTLS